MRDFHYLDAWHKAHAYTLAIYRTTETFPKTETFGLSATLRRGSASIAMKIAEACGRDHNDDYIAGCGTPEVWAWRRSINFFWRKTFSSSNR